MTPDFLGSRRSTPPHTPDAQPYAAANTATNNDMQQVAPAHSNVQEQALPSQEDFTISVEQVRAHFRSKGLTKSKDTVQRWCRMGDLNCQKRGVLGRYFTTEASLLQLEQKLLPDMIAENAGNFQVSIPEVQPHAAEDAVTTSDTQMHAAADTGALSDTPPDVQVHTPERSIKDAEPQSLDAARLSAQVEGLQAQLENRDKQIEFLQEEIRSGREQRGAVVQISNRMLETLETMAIGGRLERPRQQGSSHETSPQTVHVVPKDRPSGRV